MTKVMATKDGELIDVIARLAANPDANIDMMERLFALRQREQDRAEALAFNEAMNAAQAEMGPISQDASNPQTKSKYASYTALDKALRPIYTKHGFSLSFGTGDGAPENWVRVICKVAHNAGHSDHPHLDMPADGKGAKGSDVQTKTHATMSAVSYARRGLLKMIFNISEGDDDGNAAGNEPITKEMADEINEFCDKHEVKKPALCKHFKAASIPEILLKDYGRVMKALEKKK